MKLTKIFSDSFVDNRDRPAVSSYSTGLTLDYNGLAARIERVRLLFEMLNLKEGTHIAVIGSNSIDWITNYLASLFSGMLTITLQSNIASDDLLGLLAMSDVEVMLIDKTLELDYNLLSDTESLKLVLSQDVQTVLFSRLDTIDTMQLKINGLDQLFVETYPAGFVLNEFKTNNTKGDTPAAIFYTSGTLGVPKPVLMTRDNLEGNLIFGIRQQLFPAGSATLTTNSLGSVWGVIYNVLVPLASGAMITVFRDFYSPESLIKAFRKVHPRRVTLSPSQIEAVYTVIERWYKSGHTYKILKLLPFHRYFENLTLRRIYNNAMGRKCDEVIVGSTNINRQLKFKLYRVGVRFTVAYGLVETGGLVSYVPTEGFVADSVGHPIPNLIRTRIRPLELPGMPDGSGLLELSGMTVMKNYYNDEDSTRQAFTSDGWFNTGDLVVEIEDGMLKILGRIDSIIRRKDITIAPERVEARFKSYTGIHQALLVDHDGVLTLMVHPDYDNIKGDVKEFVDRAVKRLKSEIPPQIVIQDVEVLQEPFELTLKDTVARYKYL